MATYSNPIISGFNPDPSVVRVGDDFYLVTSSFEYFPGVPVYHSRDLINWEKISHCLNRRSQLELDGCGVSSGIYAPTIRYHDGIFYMTTTNMTDRRNFYVISTDPKGPWSDPIYVDIGGIDPSIFFDDDGKAYFTANPWINGVGGIWGAEIDIKSGKLKGELHHFWGGTGGKDPEGGHIYKINGWYYLMIAEGGTRQEHCETIARSKTIFGKYEPCPHNPILSNRSKKSDIRAIGHAELFEDVDGNWWIVFLGVRFLKGEFSPLGRETFLAPVKWVDGWPVVYDGKVIQCTMETDADRVANVKKSSRLTKNNSFEKGNLDWVYLRNPNEEDYKFDGGRLILTGSDISLDDLASPTFLAIRQVYHDSVFSVCMDFDTASSNEEAGITVYMCAKYHYDMFVSVRDSKRKVVVRRYMGDICTEVFEKEIDKGDIVLSVKTSADKYIFGFGKDRDSIEYICSAYSKFISPQVADGPFTGMLLGVYSTGNGKKCMDSTVYKWYDYSDI